MKKISWIAISVLSLFGFAGVSFADETTSEKAGATVNDTERNMKKDAHRMQEKACEKKDKDGYCLDDKIKNRSNEIKDYSKDKSQETKNKVD